MTVRHKKLNLGVCFNLTLVCIFALGPQCLVAAPRGKPQDEVKTVDAIISELGEQHRFEGQVQKVFQKVRPATVTIQQVAFSVAGLTTGVLVSEDGYVMTAGHCVRSPGTKYTIVLHDGRKFPASGLGMAEAMDCGLIKIKKFALKGARLPFAELGWSAELKAGDPCLSLGNSGGGLEGRPVVARLGFVVQPFSATRGLLQSSCLMEPGDSGGPLFDMQGRVIGIHSLISQSLDQNYEVPVDLFRRYWPTLITGTTFRAHQDVDSPFGLKLIRSRGKVGVNATQGVEVANVTENGWAAEGGIETSDRVSEFAGEDIGNSHQLELLMFQQYILKKNKVPLVVQRDGKRVELALDFSDLPPITHISKRAVYQPPSKGQANVELDVATSLATLKSGFAALESRLDDYSVEIDSGGKERISVAGTILRFKGNSYVISKSSRVKAKPVIRANQGVKYVPQVLYRDLASDTVVLTMDSSVQGVDVSLVVESSNAPFRILLSPSLTGKGEIGLQGAEPFTTAEPGYLGVTPIIKIVSVVVVDQVAPGSAAKHAGVLPGDIVMTLNGSGVTSLAGMARLLRRLRAGDEVRLVVQRDDESLTLVAMLGHRPSLKTQSTSTHIAETFAGGTSDRYKGFGQVLVHDSPIEPAACGGPVFLSSGDFAGINIARRSRTRSYAIPAARVKNILELAIEKSKDP